jgi:transcriptional regulator with XRE-family HTH domain
VIIFYQKLRIESLRKKHKLTIRGLAELSGVSKSVIGDIAIGVKTKLSRKQEDGFCRAFGCDTINLYTKEDE